MSEHRATVRWRRESPDFQYRTYNRAHAWTFGGGAEVAASAAPEYLGDPERVNPEDAFVAALSSCHMLTFLALATKARLVVDAYVDEAVGYLEKDEHGRLAVTRVVLRPRIAFGGGEPPSPEALDRLHRGAHERCFIANSVRTVVTVEAAAPAQ